MPQMSCNQNDCPNITSEALVLTENEMERDRWLATLEELQKAAKQSTQQQGVSKSESCRLVACTCMYMYMYIQVFCIGILVILAF